MAIQKRNDDRVQLLAADFQRRTEATFAWSRAISMLQTLPGLRGLWPLSAFQQDLSGYNNALTYNGDGYYGYDGLIPYAYFDGTGDYLSHADDADFDITGAETYVKAGQRGLTLGGWFRPEDDSASQGLISKIGAAGNYSYQLFLDGTQAGDPVRMFISDDGTNYDTATSTATTSMNTWQFMAGRFNDAKTGAEIAVWLNDNMDTGATARNSIKDGNGPLNISGSNNGSSLYTGRASMCFLCACALDDAHLWAIYQLTRPLFRV